MKVWVNGKGGAVMALDPMNVRMDPLQPAGDRRATASVNPVSGSDFKKILLDNINQVNAMQQDAGQLVTDLVTGREQDITKVMTAVEKADVAFQTLKAVRDKIVDAYQEIMRMRI